MNAVDILGATALIVGSINAFGPLMQSQRILRLRSSHDVSLAALTVLWFNCIAWGLYGLSISNLALIISNAITLTCTTMTIAVVQYFRRPHTAVNS